MPSFSHLFSTPWRSCRGTYVMLWSCQHGPTSQRQPNLECPRGLLRIGPSRPAASLEFHLAVELSSVRLLKRPRQNHGRPWAGAACREGAGHDTADGGKHVRLCSRCYRSHGLLGDCWWWCVLRNGSDSHPTSHRQASVFGPGTQDLGAFPVRLSRILRFFR